LRIAAIAFIAGLSSWRETNRAKSDAAIAGTGTALSIAASTVQRPSPESWTKQKVLQLRILRQRGGAEIEQPG
jgi:hypothetical protein